MFTYRENGSSPLFTFRATDPEGGAIIWSISGKDEDDFTISETGVLSFANSPDYENPTDSGRDNIYEVTVMAWDDALNSAALEVTVTVTEVNEGPEISRVGNPPGNVPENYDETQVLARYRATDPEDTGAVITRWSTSGTDGGDFVMNEQGELRFRYTPDYERPADSNRDNVYTFSVRASDGRYYGYREVTVEVTPVNEPPTITTTSTSATELRQAENRTTRLYTYRATDSERAAITWSVGGTDRNHFAIDERGQFSFGETSPPDFDARSDSDNDNVYEVTVRATDDDNNTATLDVTVTVTEVNEGPEITGGTATITRPENHPQDQVLATYSGTDPESPGSPITLWSASGTDGGDFVMNEDGELRFRYSPDYERPADSTRDNVYTFSVRASDGRYYGYLEVTVEVTPVNEPPTITTTSTSATELRQAENRTTRLYTYRATDSERAAITWSVGGTDRNHFAINERGEFSFDENNAPDFELPGDAGGDNVYNVTVQATDDDANTANLDVTVTVT